MLKICRAEIGDSENLTNLATRSETYWGHDCNFMEKFNSIYNVSEKFISNNPTFVIKEDELIVGFYGILIGKNKTSLEYLFIEPRSIGKGYGKLLWNHMVKNCKNLGIKEVEIVSSPKAEDFYIKMGAKQCGKVDSPVVKGGKIPRLIYIVEK